MCHLWYERKLNRLGNLLGLDMRTRLIGKGLMIYHCGNVINGCCEIGENLHLHGDVTIGNTGRDGNLVPTIGNGVMVGAGARLIGDITIADGVAIGAGSVVVHSVEEPDATVAGVPARKIK